MGDRLGGGDSHVFLAEGNEYQYKLNDLVDVFVGTGANIRGTKTIPVRGRFKGVRVVGGKEMFWYALLWDLNMVLVLPFRRSRVSN
jgi:hypothetical protein